MSLTHRPPLPAGDVSGSHFDQLRHYVPPHGQFTAGYYSRDFSPVMV